MNKIPLLLRALPLFALWLLGQPLTAAPFFSEPASPAALAEDFCELPPPDTVWIVGATQNSIKIAWKPVAGAYTYEASVINLDGGSAPPAQVIPAPTTDASFTVAPGKYKFTVKATSCPSGSYGEGRTVIGSTAIIIDEVVLEFCTPNNNRMPVDFTVCVPYGFGPETKSPVRAISLEGKVNSFGNQVPWKADFRLMMPCPGAFAFDLNESQSSNIIVFGSPVGNGSNYDLSFYTESPFALIFKINSLSWCTSNPAIVCPNNNNNGCGHGYGSCIVDLMPAAGVTIQTIKDNNIGTDQGKCQGSAPSFGWCINNPVMYKSASEPDLDDSHILTPSEGSAAGLLRVVPNPFTFGTTITYGLTEDSPLNLALYDAMGRPVKTLEQSDLTPAGVYHFELEADGLPTGMYYLVLQTSSERRITPLVKSE